MIPEIQYTCPRCGFKTKQRNDMRRHLNRKKICPCKDEELILTDEIKEKILKNRIYYAPVVIPISRVCNSNDNVKQIINNYFTDPFDMLNALTKYKNVKMLTIENSINDKYFEKRSNYERNANVFYNKLTIDDLIEVLDKLSISSSSDYNDFNLMYHKKTNKISYIEDDGMWRFSLVDKGLSILLEKVQESFFHNYECYLIRKIRRNEEAELSMDMLKEYYKFIAVFYIQPITYSTDDSTILENDDANKFTCVEQFYPIYRDIKSALKDSERAYIRKLTIDVIKKNTICNGDRLSSDIHTIFSREDEFRKFLESK